MIWTDEGVEGNRIVQVPTNLSGSRERVASPNVDAFIKARDRDQDLMKLREGKRRGTRGPNAKGIQRTVTR